MFNKLLLVFVIILIPGSLILLGQTPHEISYQGYITNDIGTPFNEDKKITFRIYDAGDAGNMLWDEVHETVEIRNGIFRVFLGSIKPINLPFDKQYWIGVEVEEQTELVPRARLTSVGYSFHSINADSTKTIPDNIVTSSKITSNAIGTNQIEDGAITREKIAGNSITSDIINDIPGVAAKYGPPFFSLSNIVDNQTVLTLSINTPDSGYVIWEASGSITVRHGKDSTDDVGVNILRDPQNDQITDYGLCAILIPSVMPESINLPYAYPFTCRKLIPVNSAEQLTMHLVIKQSMGQNISETKLLYPVLSATYYPKSYGEISSNSRNIQNINSESISNWYLNR